MRILCARRRLVWLLGVRIARRLGGVLVIRIARWWRRWPTPIIWRAMICALLWTWGLVNLV